MSVARSCRDSPVPLTPDLQLKNSQLKPGSDAPMLGVALLFT